MINTVYTHACTHNTNTEDISTFLLFTSKDQGNDLVALVQVPRFLENFFVMLMKKFGSSQICFVKILIKFIKQVTN